MRYTLIAICISILLLSVVRENGFGAIQTKQMVLTQSGIGEKIEYQLAWPGMLPDHPLYKLKVLRDKVMYRFIKKPVKKLEFYLLQTDKGISAASLLFEKGNVRLAQETVLKAEHNYTQLISDYKWMFLYAIEIPDELRRKIKTAAIKHQEVLGVIARGVSEKDAMVFLQVKDFSRRNLEELELLNQRTETAK